jgi:hypothetical protein
LRRVSGAKLVFSEHHVAVEPARPCRALDCKPCVDAGRRAKDFPDDSSAMTLGEDPLDWHFVLGDSLG